MSFDQIISSWKKKVFKPVYWIDGEEDYYINRIVDFAEHDILTEAEAGFNLTVFYGKDAGWPDVVNACCRYPMFAERQVVLLKEAQLMKDIDKLDHYLSKPLSSTIFIISYKGKKLDGRTALARTLKEKPGIEVLTTKKLRDNQLAEWTSTLLLSEGYTISPKALVLIVENIGNDLIRISKEIEKLSVNLGERKNISEDDVEKYVGISKEYNMFELQDAFGNRDLSKAIRIIQYFETNPKAYPIQLILPTIYSFFSKCYMAFSVMGSDEKTIATTIGVSPFFIRNYTIAVKKYAFEGIERAILLLHEYNLKSIGINDSGTEDGSLLRELAFKIIR